MTVIKIDVDKLKNLIFGNYEMVELHKKPFTLLLDQATISEDKPEPGRKSE